ncbi:DNA-binding protein WhiA [Tumebacillus algifaecis]|uniref:Probable cell division protein WhiA n=1 Tax=Tumebacillus algifaecis TaxID=1214604 RepID=A0A223D513_9BACL|nr:DNA-binding protein WhiA [Tumebacillus algifaecis]ASS76516.1 DNA-binding protein WhiA [Tumebacillus algifaecis]
MSFAARTKKELTQLDLKPCCKRAELAALIRMNGTVLISGKRISLDVTTENAAIARRMYTLLKELFGVHAEILVRKKMRLKKNNVYMMRVPFQVREILQELCIAGENLVFVAGINQELVKKNCCKRSYLRGVFLAGGSVNDPEGSSYHLEIASNDYDHSAALLTLINEYDLNAKLIDRKKSYVVYLKEVEKIIEFLNIIGAHQALLKFEDIRIVKGMRNQVNRLVNCETANLNKTIEASVRQIENIKLLERVIGLQNLPPRLREVAELRLQFPDINLKELGEMLPSVVSKSGVNHRLRKLDELAEKAKTGYTNKN